MAETIATLRQKMQRAIQSEAKKERRSAIIPAEIVAFPGDNDTEVAYVYDENGVPETNKVWVQTYDSDRPIPVYNVKVQYVPGAPVWITEDPAGDVVIADIQARKGSDLYESAASSVGTPIKYGEVVQETIDAQNIMQGRVTLSSIGPLYVHVDPFLYQVNGEEVAFEGGDLDLEPYLPTASGYWSWIRVGVNPSTNTLTAVASEEKGFRDLLTLSLLTQTNTGSMIRLDALQVQEGTTALTRNNNFTYGRIITSSPGLSNLMPLELDYVLTVPTNTQVATGEISIVDDGELDIEGEITFV